MEEKEYASHLELYENKIEKEMKSQNLLGEGGMGWEGREGQLVG